ncbi:MAG: hypothetical protein J6Y84_02720 [Bacteroidaceae bacterium]|nr:hypothetical protein [Bacteroidaceae bacterium]
MIYHAKHATWLSDHEHSEQLNYAETKSKCSEKGVFLRFLRAKQAFFTAVFVLFEGIIGIEEILPMPYSVVIEPFRRNF